MSTTQDHQMAAVLIRLEMVSHGSTQAWNASGGHSGEPDDRMVSMVIRSEDPPHLVYRRRYDGCCSHTSREAVLEEAKAELESWTKRTSKVPESVMSDTELILTDYEGLSPEVIARRFGWHPAAVRRLRVRNGLEPEGGRKPGAVSDPSSRARELREQGMSTRDIATALSAHQTQVMRWIRA